MTIQQSKDILLLLNKVKKIISKNYLKYDFSMTKTENTKVKRKILVKY